LKEFAGQDWLAQLHCHPATSKRRQVFSPLQPSCASSGSLDYEWGRGEVLIGQTILP
jgi:hypothetical protein